MRCIGWVCSTPTSHITKKYSSSSTYECAYFSHVTFQYLEPNYKIGSIILISSPSLFENCRSTFHSHSDYQSSSISTYLPHQICIQQKKGLTKLSPSDQMGMKLQRDPNNLVSMGQVCKTYMRNNIDYNLGKDLLYPIFIILQLHWPGQN
jgi:hypothetical protein